MKTKLMNLIARLLGWQYDLPVERLPVQMLPATPTEQLLRTPAYLRNGSGHDVAVSVLSAGLPARVGRK